MRLVIIFILLSIYLQAKSSKSCYTVQIMSAFNNKTNNRALSKVIYPDSCKLMHIGKSSTIRCGCFNHINKAKKKLGELKSKYRYAYVTTTYRYRFKNSKSDDSFINDSQNTTNYNREVERLDKGKNLIYSDSELKLMLQSFLYTKDLESAYKIAKMGYRRNPNSYYWNQKMAELSRWSGRGPKALKYMKFMYNKKHNTKLEEDIIDYGLRSYHYENIKDVVVNAARRNPSAKNIDKMIYVYSKIGNTEKVAEILKKWYLQNKRKTIYLTDILQIYMDLGDIESAQKMVNIIEKRNLYTVRNTKLLSYFYYRKHNVQKAYDVLLKVKNAGDDISYYQLLSDLGWYLQKFKNAGEASQKIIKEGEGRLVDYERVVDVNIGKNYNLAILTSLNGYKKYKKSYLFYTFANSAIKHGHFDELKQVIDEIDTKNAKIRREPEYWITRAEVYKYFHNIKEAKNSLEKALKLNPNNIRIQLTAMYLYMDYNMYDELKNSLKILSENPNLTQSFYYPLATAYFSIHDINRASYYVNKLLQNKADITKKIDFKFLEADIYKSRNNENAFMSKIYEIAKILKNKVYKNPKIQRTDRYWTNYLKANVNILAPDVYESKLSKAKKYLTKAHYEDFEYAWAMRNNSKQKAYEIYQQTETKALWLRFTNAMQLQNHTQIENLLQKYLKTLPIGDVSGAAYNDGQISLAQSMAYKALYTNDDSQNSYIQHLDLSKERSNKFDSKFEYYNRNPLLRQHIDIKNSTYLDNNLFLITGMKYFLNSTLDKNVLLTVPNDTVELSIGLKKLFQRGYIQFNGAVVDSMEFYPLFSFLGSYKLNNSFTANFSLSKNIKSDETTQLLLGGKKDRLSLGGKITILKSTTLDFLYEMNRFNSQDNVYLGSGNYARVILGHQIRNGYPDMRIATFADYGNYNETSGSKGVIDKLQKKNNKVLPKQFYNLGLNFTYGMANSDIYTRVWRPYIDVSSYYNSEIKDYSYSVNSGYGGKIWNQDHLILGASYSESVNGIGGTVFNIFLKYQFLYTNY